MSSMVRICSTGMLGSMDRTMSRARNDKNHDHHAEQSRNNTAEDRRSTRV